MKRDAMKPPYTGRDDGAERVGTLPVADHNILTYSMTIERGREIGVEDAIDEHECDVARGIRAVAPRVIGPALDQHVARLQQHFARIEHAVDFAREHESVVDRLRAV